jgi:CheY-like chemotaxis protein
MKPQSIKVFISYAHKDEALRRALDDHLALLIGRGVIDAWHDRHIVAGADWAVDIDAALSEARLVLLLVTPAFFASGYCTGIELKRALQRQRDEEISVIPVIMKEGDFAGAPFSHLKELPTDGLAKGRSVTGRKWQNRDEALRDVTEGIRLRLEALQATRVVARTTRIYEAKAGHPPSQEDTAEIAGLVKTFGRIVSGRRVLWVDDLPENNDAETAALEELGVNVIRSTGTEQALDLLASGSFHLVLSDWARPAPAVGATSVSEGIRLLELMRYRDMHQPVIFYTGWLAAQDLRQRNAQAIKAGATGVTASPRELLRWCIGELLRSAALDRDAAFVPISLYGDST